MVYVMLGDGFEEIEATAPVDLLRRAGIPVLTVGVTGQTVPGSHGIPVCADISISEMDLTQLDMIVLPGGMKGVASLSASQAVLDAVRFAWENGRFVAAICAAPTILAGLGLTAGREVTCYPSCADKLEGATVRSDRPWVRDGRLITGASAGCAVPFGLALIAALKGEDAANAVADKIVIR